MHRKISKSWLRVTVALLAACLSGVLITQAAEKPAQPGGVSEAPIKNLKHGKRAKLTKQEKKAVEAGQKDQAGSEGEIAQLKKQLAVQQEQIARLLEAMTKLQAQVAATARPSKKDAAVAQLSSNAAAAPAAQASSDNEVASLAPILPPMPKTQSDEAFGKNPRFEREIGLDEATQRNRPGASASSRSTTVSSLAQVSSPIPRGEKTAASPTVGNPAVGSVASVGQAENGSGIPESPLQFHLGTAYFTPVGFMDFTSVYRSTNVGSGIGTNFGSIPYGRGFDSNLSEFSMSMQNSRVGVRIDALVHGAHVLGYMESDFLGNAPGNLEVSSNSNTLRSRVFWADVRKGAWEMLGGQTWSLITPGRKGISAIPGDLFFTQNIDVNYQLGLVWGRIPEFRLVYHPSAKAALAFAIDEPQQYAGGSAGGSLITFPSDLASVYGNQLNTGGNGTKVPNVAPDFIAKLAFDPSERFHFEIGGVERNFKLWNPSTGISYTAAGGGGFLNLNFGLYKGLRLVTNNFWSDGGGRYIFGQAPDLIAQADGSPSLIHASSTVSGLEFTHKNSLLYGYYGGLYVGKNVAIDSDGTFVGYGYPGAPSGQNRAVQEATFGFNQTIWKNPTWGAINFMGQYSYLTRNPWSVAAGSPANAATHMMFINLRYTLPGSAPTLK